MRNIDNWDEIQERKDGEITLPAPGGYVARITSVEDHEDREYLRIEWDFTEGEYKGSNLATFTRAGFWPTALFRSYKMNAIGFFKGFKTCVETSNPGYTFRTSDVHGLEGKLLGVVLGLEEYRRNNGTVGTRLYVAQTRSVQAIRNRDFQTPELKRLSGSDAPRQFVETPRDDDNEELPF